MEPQTRAGLPLGSYRPVGGLPPRMTGGYEAWASHGAEDPLWEAFLARTPGAHYTQSSLWARMKALHSWRATRVVVVSGEQIVAGAQLLVHPLPLVGAIGYVPKGPLAPAGEPAAARVVLEAVHRVAQAQRVRYLAVQPAQGGYPIARELRGQGFQPQARLGTCTATLLIDLTQAPEVILAQMKKRTRANIRRAQELGISVREGGEGDLDAFYGLLVAAGKRKRFPVYGREHYAALWRTLAPHGHLKLFLAEYEGEAVAAQLAIPFGDTLFTHVSAWSGAHGGRKPNEALEWAAISWAQAQGYRSYDFEGVDPRAAQAIVRGEPPPEALAPEADSMVTSFKLGFGGAVTLLPGAFDHIYNPLLRWGYRTLFPTLQRWRILTRLRKAVSRLVQPPMARREAAPVQRSP